MRQPKLKVLLRTDKPTADNSYPIWIRITHQRKSSYIATGYACQEEEWDTEASRLYEGRPRITPRQKAELNPKELEDLKKTYSIVKVNPLAKKINAEIDKKVRKVFSTKDKLEANEQALSSKILKKQLEGPKVEESGKSFIKYWQRQHSILEGLEVYSTLKTSKSILKQLQEGFLKDKDLSFDEINVDFLEAYKAYLTREGYAKKTIHNHLKTFRSILYKAIKEPGKNYFSQDKNPFFAFKLEADKAQKKERLTSEEIKALKELDLQPGTRQFDTRNIFLFSYYNAGIRIGDLLQLRWTNISREGRLEYIMDKTEQTKSVKLLPQALDIIRHYKAADSRATDYLFPFLKNDIKYTSKSLRSQVESKTALINKCLKQLAEMAKIEKKLTSHIARHSFADMARKKKVSLYDIQGLLGHADISTTKRYLASLDLDSQDMAHALVFSDL